MRPYYGVHITAFFLEIFLWRLVFDLFWYENYQYYYIACAKSLAHAPACSYCIIAWVATCSMMKMASIMVAHRLEIVKDAHHIL